MYQSEHVTQKYLQIRLLIQQPLSMYNKNITGKSFFPEMNFRGKIIIRQGNDED